MHILHPFLRQPECARGKENLKGIYKMLRVMTINNKITFNAVMFNEDKTQCALDLTEYLETRASVALGRPGVDVPFLVRVDLRLDSDGKYRISKQIDNFPCFTKKALPWYEWMYSNCMNLSGLWTIGLGRFLLYMGWGGP